MSKMHRGDKMNKLIIDTLFKISLSLILIGAAILLNTIFLDLGSGGTIMSFGIDLLFLLFIFIILHEN